MSVPTTTTASGMPTTGPTTRPTFDLRAVRLPFGGAAFEPLSGAARDFLDALAARFEANDTSCFRPPDGCIADLAEGSLGWEPQMTGAVFGEARSRDLAVDWGSG